MTRSEYESPPPWARVSRAKLFLRSAPGLCLFLDCDGWAESLFRKKGEKKSAKKLLRLGLHTHIGPKASLLSLATEMEGGEGKMLSLRVRSADHQTSKTKIHSSATLLQLKEQLQTHLKLSLDKRIPLQPDEQTLQTLGIKNGDLIYIIHDDTQNSPDRPQPRISQPLTSITQSQASRDEPSTTQSLASTTQARPSIAQLQAMAPAQVREANDRSTAGGTPTRPDSGSSVIRTQSGFPELMLSNLAHASQDLQCSEVVVLALHSLLSDSGFVRYGDTEPFSYDQPLQFPEESRMGSGIFVLRYQRLLLPDDAHVNVEVKCVELGNCLILHALARRGNQDTLQTIPLQASFQLQGPTAVQAIHSLDDSSKCRLSNLLRQLNKRIVQPLQMQMRAPDSILQLSDLSSELKFAILANLDAPTLCRVACVCRALSTLSRDEALWGPLFASRFPSSSAVYVSAGSSSSFRDSYRAALEHERRAEAGRRQRERDEEARRLHFMRDHFAHPYGDGSLDPFGGSRGIPAVGGDYDRMPFPPFPGGFPRAVPPPEFDGFPPRYMPAPGMPGGVVPMPLGAVPPGARYDPICPGIDGNDAGAGLFDGAAGVGGQVGGIGSLPGRGRGVDRRFGRGRDFWDPDSCPGFPGPL